MLNFSGRTERAETSGSASRTGDCGTSETGGTGETSGSVSCTGDYEASGTGGVQKRDFYLWVKK